ncbi:DNA-binding Xre family transcriptional regulator [Branchiibius hedensis]|uniref:DNA-binding transcriptional regulator, XRE family n=1 Tax=Branchiibius hedensis TaxID=672460 RepID=A0A2Y9CAW6_9MICO|nr:helix-turn-helix transcriptional regulator [Branchiibius hedensis]PWJ23307.1 DNA-binding Xre family transcriptional regulator [Branchiibius hedensis]SSA58996.1 DNA-binding transcriptional regulator, XRE family [Branchiibius hedensis]
MGHDFEVVAWRLRSVMAARDVRFAADLHRRLVEVLGSNAPSSVQVARLVRGVPGRLTMRVLDGLCVALACTPGDLLEADSTTRRTIPAQDTPQHPPPGGLVDTDVLGGPRTVQAIADVARDRGIPSWPTEAAFIADDPDRRRSAHFIRGRLLDAPHDAGEWVLKHVVPTHEVYAYRTPPAAERFALADDPVRSHAASGRVDGTGDQWGPCYLLGLAYDTSIVLHGIEQADISDRPGAITWVHGRLTLLNTLLKALALGSPAGTLEDGLRRYVDAPGEPYTDSSVAKH